jgi:hypothetical protein
MPDYNGKDDRTKPHEGIAKKCKSRKGKRMIFQSTSRTATYSKFVGAALLATLTACSLAACSQKTGEVLRDYTALSKALDDGRSVTTQMDFRRCTLGDGNLPGPPLRGGHRVGSYLILEDRYIAFSDTHQTLDPGDRAVTEYVRFRVAPNGLVVVDTFKRPDGSETATPLGSFQCKINEGIRFVISTE